LKAISELSGVFPQLREKINGSNQKMGKGRVLKMFIAKIGTG